MARLKNYQADMTAGVLDPLIAARVDTEIYRKGVEVGDNVVPLVQGGMRRRPGSRHIATLPRRIAPIGPNLVLGGQDSFGNTIVHFGLDGLPDGVGNDIIARVLNAVASPDGTSTADRISFTGALAVSGIRHGMGTTQGITPGILDTRVAGTYTYGIWLRLNVATTQDITWTIHIGRRACFPAPLLLFEVPNCYPFETVSTTVDMNDVETWHHLVVTIEKPITDGLPIEIDISHDAGVGVNPEFAFWGNQFFLGDRLPRTLSNSGTGLGATVPNGGTATSVADYNVATSSVTTTALGTISPFVVAQLNLIDHFDVAMVDVRGIQLVTGTGSAPEIVNEFRLEYAQNLDAASWTPFGGPFELVDGVKRDYRRGIAGDEFFIGDAASNKQFIHVRLVRIGGTDGTDFEVSIDDFNVHIYEYTDANHLHDYVTQAILQDLNNIRFTAINATIENATQTQPRDQAISTNGDAFLETAVTGEHGVSIDIEAKASRTYTARCSCKKRGGGFSSFGIVVNLGGGDEPFAGYNIVTGPSAGVVVGNLDIGPTPANGAGRIFNERNGYFRLEFDFTVPTTGTFTVRYLGAANTSGGFSYLGNAGNGYAVTDVTIQEKLKPQEESNTRLIPFSFNTGQNYVLALTEFNMTIYRTDNILPTDPTNLTSLGTVLTTFTRSAYNNDQLKEISWVQSADTLFMFHPQIVPQRLTRLGDTEWLLDDFPFTGIADDDLGDGNGATDIWASNGRGWPQCGTFHQGRLWLAGAFLTPNRLVGSNIADIFNFDPGATPGDSDAVDVTLDTDQINEIRQLRGGRRLEIYTSGSEFVANDVVLTPASIAIARQSNIGIADALQPVNIDGATLFLGRDLSQGVENSQTLWQFLFDFAEDAFRPSDVALLSQHLLTDPIDVDAQPAKQSYIYVTNEDGTIAVFLTSRQQEIAAWSRWTRRGSSKYLNCAVVQDGTLWAITRDTRSDGQQFTSLELFDENANLDNIHSSLVDTSGVTFNIGSTTIFSTTEVAPQYLRGIPLRLRFTEDTLLPTVFISPSESEYQVGNGSASFQLPEPTSQFPAGVGAGDIVEIGKQIDVKVKTMPVSFAFPNGSTFGEFIRLVKVVLRLNNTQGIVINNRRVPNFATELSGFHEEYLDGWGKDAQVEISQTDPYPFTLLGANIEFEV